MKGPPAAKRITNKPAHVPTASPASSDVPAGTDRPKPITPASQGGPAATAAPDTIAARVGQRTRSGGRKTRRRKTVRRVKKTH